MTDNLTHDERLELVIATYLDDVASGVAVDREAVLHDHPALANDLVSFFQLHDKLRIATRQLDSPSTANKEADATQLAAASDTVFVAAAEPATRPLRRFGDYLLVEEIGRGGMGLVFKARQLGLDRLVALKILRSERLSSDEEVRRFQAEPKAAAKLDHPGIAPIYDVGSLDGTPYYSMGYVEGETLTERLKAGPLDPREAAVLMVKIAEAVQYAHEQEVLHRDLKPSNILLDKTGVPRVVDFGLAKSTITDDLTATGQILGTPAYMSPEQAAADFGRVGPASDLYSLGATLYAMLTGRPPFQSAHVFDTLAQVRSRQPVEPRELNPLVPRDLETICLKCLEKARRRRYDSVRGFADDLQRYLDGQPIVARPVGQLERCARWVHRNPFIAAWSFATVGILVLATVCLSFLVMWLNDARQDSSHNAELAKTSERERTDQLWNSYLDQARARRWSGHDGQRFSSLDVLGKAAAIRPTLELRTEAIACMALPDLRLGKEWPIFTGKPDDRIGGLVIDENYQRLARSDLLGNITVKNIRDDQQLAFLPGAGTATWFMRFSPDGQFLAAEYQSTAFIVWDIANQREVLRLTESIGAFAAAFAPDSRWIAVGAGDDSIRIYDLPDGKLSRKLSGIPKPFWIAIDPTGSRLASTSFSHDITIVDLGSGDILATIGTSTSIRVVTWHPYRDMLAAGGTDGRIHLFDASTGKRISVLTGHQSSVVELCFSHGDGRILASHSWDGAIRLWDHEVRQEVVHLYPIEAVGRFPMLHFSPDNRFVSHRFSAKKKTIRLVETSLADECLPVYVAKGQNPYVHGLAFNPDSRVLAIGSYDLNLWQVGTGKQLAAIDSLNAGWLSWHPSGDAIFASSNETSSRLLGMWPLTVATDSHEIVRWSVGAFEEVWQGSAVWQHAMAESGSPIAVADNTRVVLLAPDSPTRLLSEFPMKEEVRRNGAFAVAVSPKMKFVASAGFQSAAVVVWDLESAKELAEIPIGNANAAFIGFSPDGEWLITGDTQYFRFYDTESWQPGPQINRAAGSAALAYSPDGQIIAAAHSSRIVRLFDAGTLAELASLEPRSPGLISTLAFSPNGAFLAIGTENRVTNIWNLKLVRQGLRNIGLDWDLPEIESDQVSPPLKMTVERADPPSPSEESEQASAQHPVQSPSKSLLVLARDLCHEQRWNDAITLLQAIVSPEQFATDSGVYRTAMFYQPPILVRLENRDRYHDFCHELLIRFRDSDNVSLLEQTAKASLFVPPREDNLRLAAQVAKHSYELAPHAWSNLVIALATFREGKFDESRMYCQAVIKPGQHWYLKAEAQLVLSMIHAHAGEVDAAHAALDDARESLANVAPQYEQAKTRDGYQDWLICETLLHEAESLLSETTVTEL